MKLSPDNPHHDDDETIRDLLRELAGGDRAALQEIVSLVYSRLRRMARRQLAAERRGHTLDSIALVNETFLNLVDQERLVVQDRAHFLAVAARVMRRILVDHARARNAQKRGRGKRPLPLDEAAAVSADRADEDLLAMDAALHRLSAIDAQAVSVVEQRYFVGATEAETGRALGISPATVRRRWAFAKAWLYQELRGGTQHGAGARR